MSKMLNKVNEDVNLLSLKALQSVFATVGDFE